MIKNDIAAAIKTDDSSQLSDSLARWLQGTVTSEEYARQEPDNIATFYEGDSDED